jgi:hypothetical protein
VVQKFKEGRGKIENDAHHSWPCTKTGANIEKVGEIVQELIP